MSRRRKTRRKWNKAGIAGWILLLAVVIAGGIWFVRSGKTKYTSVNDGIGEMTAKANEGVMDKGTGDSMYREKLIRRRN